MLRNAFCSMCLVCLTFLPVMAQDISKVEVFGGYTWAGGNFHGWNSSVTGNVTKRFGIIADFSGHYGSELAGTDSGQAGCAFISFRAAILLSRKEIHPFCLRTVRGYAISRKRNRLRSKVFRL